MDGVGYGRDRPRPQHRTARYGSVSSSGAAPSISRDPGIGRASFTSADAWAGAVRGGVSVKVRGSRSVVLIASLFSRRKSRVFERGTALQDECLAINRVDAAHVAGRAADGGRGATCRRVRKGQHGAARGDPGPGL